MLPYVAGTDQDTGELSYPDLYPLVFCWEADVQRLPPPTLPGACSAALVSAGDVARRRAKVATNARQLASDGQRRVHCYGDDVPAG